MQWKGTVEVYIITVFIWLFLAASFLIDHKLKQAGVRVPLFKNPSNYFRERREFLRLARERGWSLVPVYLELSSALIVLIAIGSFAARNWP